MKLQRCSTIRAMIALVAIVSSSVGDAGRADAVEVVPVEVVSDWARLLESMDYTSSHGSTGTGGVSTGFLERTGNAKLHPFGSVLHGVRPYGKLGLGELPGKEFGRSSDFYDRISSAHLDRDSGFVMRFGAGAELPLGESWSVQTGVGYDRALSETIEGYEALTAIGGFTLRW